MFVFRVWAAFAAIVAATLFGGFSASAMAAGLILPVPVTTIYPGEIIDSSMVEERAMRAGGIGRHIVVQDRSGLIGKTARRTLLPGHPVPANAVEAPPLVARGAAIVIIFQEGGLMIRAQATALEAGSPGDLIRIRNLDSGIMINATVQADGSVRVGQL